MAINISDTNGLPYIVDPHTGEFRYLANLPSPMQVPRFKWFIYGETDTTPLIPRSRWAELIQEQGNDLDHPFLPPLHDQDSVGQCFPAGTLIRMGDGSQKPIEQVRVLDEVLTAECRVRKVTKTMVRQEKECLYRLLLNGHRHLRGTAEHPVLTKRGYVALQELQRGDMVALPRYMKDDPCSIIATENYVAKRVLSASKAKSSRQLGIPGKTKVTVCRHRPPEFLSLTPQFGRIIGQYLAEGWTDAGKVNWAFSAAEQETLAVELVNLIREVFDAEASIRTVSGCSGCVVVTLYGTVWAQLFESWCSKGCAGKTLHGDLVGGTKDFLIEVLRGWTDGDGLGPNSEGGVTVSHQLAMCMYDIANAVGYRPTIETLDIKANPKHGVRSRRKRYIVRWRDNLGNRPDDWRSELSDSHTWRRVDSVVPESFSGYVFNLEVEDDHSYVAEGIGVHNCNCDATASLVEFCRAQQGLPFVPLSAPDLYDRINGGADNGSLLEDALAEMLRNGIGTAATSGTVWRRGLRTASAEERSRFKVLEAFLCPTFDHCMSAVLIGCGIVSGIMWYENYTPDSTGWLPSRGSGDSGGHAVFGYKAVMRGSNDFGIAHLNSWSLRWGLNGRCVFPEMAYRGPVGGWWACRSVVTEEGELPAPVSKLSDSPSRIPRSRRGGNTKWKPKE